ncbi:MAG: hypothetical protein JXQ93_01135 [Flavobacteriaceae bacterium]
MNLRVIFFLFLFPIILNAQQKITRVIKSEARHIDIYLDGIDNLKIEESNTNAIEMIVLDQNELGVFENFSCENKSCVLKIKSELKGTNDINNKINQFPIPPPSNVSVSIKVPKNKTVTIHADMIDIQSNGYQGVLKMIVGKGNLSISVIKGIVELALFSGMIYVTTLKDIALELTTRKGKILLNGKKVKSQYKKPGSNLKKLTIKSINGNVMLTSKKT